MVIETDDAIGIVDLVLTKSFSDNKQEFVLVDWKTRDARPMSTNDPQLAAYTVLFSNQFSNVKIKSGLALLHPRQATFLDVSHPPSFLEKMKRRIKYEIEEWRGQNSSILVCTCGNCD